MIDKLPPHSIEAEQSVLGGLMLNEKRFDDVAAVLPGDAFYRSDHRLIWTAISGLLGKGEPADVVTLADRLDKTKQLADAGGREYLATLSSVPSAANILAYAKIIREKWLLREGIGLCTEFQDAAFSGDNPETAMEALQSKLSTLAMRTQSGGLQPMGEGVAGWLNRLDERHQRGDEISGAPTGLTDLDAKTGGFEAGDLVIIAGRPSMGKTALGLQVVDNIAERQGGWAQVFSMEMPQDQLIARCAASRLGIDGELFKHPGRFTKTDWSRLMGGIQTLRNSRVLVDETPALRINELRARAKAAARKHPTKVIMVDYLQLMQSDSKENRERQVAEISAGLKQLGKELQVPVIVLSQLNRSLEARPDRRPRMSDLRESGAIEQDADVIVFVYRDEVYNRNSPDKGTAELIIGKQRMGSIGMVRAQWDSRYTRFQDLAHDWRPEEVEAPRKVSGFEPKRRGYSDAVDHKARAAGG